MNCKEGDVFRAVITSKCNTEPQFEYTLAPRTSVLWMPKRTTIDVIELIIRVDSDIDFVERLVKNSRVSSDIDTLLHTINNVMHCIEGENPPQIKTPLLSWDSKRLIGNVTERNVQLKRKRFDWRSFYNGWIEGRTAMLAELRLEAEGHQPG